MYKLQSICFAFDYKTGNLPESMWSLYPARPDYLHTRQSENIYTYRPRTDFSNKSAILKIAAHWNDLPINIKTITNRNQLIQKLKQNYLQTYADHINCNNPMCRDCFP